MGRSKVALSRGGARRRSPPPDVARGASGTSGGGEATDEVDGVAKLPIDIIYGDNSLAGILDWYRLI